MLNMCAHVCFSACIHICVHTKHLKQAFQIATRSYSVEIILKNMLAPKNWKHVPTFTQYFYTQDCFLMMSEIWNKYLQKIVHPYVINTSENLETT